jgi:hypothetical protein
MNRRMERLIPEDEYGNAPDGEREPVDFQIAVAAVDAALERILAEIAQARGAL